MAVSWITEFKQKSQEAAKKPNMTGWTPPRFRRCCTFTGGIKYESTAMSAIKTCYDMT